MNDTQIDVSAGTAELLHDATTPAAEHVDNARMIVVDLLGSADELPLAVLISQVCEAYEAPAGERIAIDLDGVLAADDLRDSPAVRHVLWVRATRLALLLLTEAGEVQWSHSSDDPDEVDHPTVEVRMTGVEPHFVTVYIGDRLPDGSVSLR